MRKAFRLAGCFCGSLLFASTLQAAEVQAPAVSDKLPTAKSSPWFSRTRFLFDEDTYVSGIDLSGPGSNIPNLATNYDLSLMELNWGGKQSLFNGSGITTNTTYPLTEGASITTQDRFGVSTRLPNKTEMGILWQLYAAGGNRGTGRTFGAQIPWDNGKRSDERLLQPDFDSELTRAWIKNAEGPLTYQVTGGNLEAIDLSRGEWNFLNLGSLLFRPPVTTASIFGKGDRRFQPGRHPFKGVDAAVTFPYQEGKNIHGNIFFGVTKPTPQQEIDRDGGGMRLSADILDGNLGLTYVRSEGERNPAITGERQSLWATDGSYKLCPFASLYGVWAHTGYHRNGRLHGNAWVSGLRILGPAKSELRTQYQYVGENYELMGYHKVEHYPSNFHGVHASLAVPFGAGAVKTLLYRLHQIETNTRPGDAIFGDSYFPALAGSKRGDITVYRLGGEYDLGKHSEYLPKLSAYLEQAHFQKDAPDTANNDIDKYITNWELLISQPVVENLRLEGGFRLVSAAGRWQTMRFHHRQIIPELAMIYRLKEKGKDQDKFRAMALYHYYDFEDSIAASAGNNNYQAHQMTFEVAWVF